MLPGHNGQVQEAGWSTQKTTSSGVQLWEVRGAMYCTTHFIAGAIISLGATSPPQALAAGLVSHALLDAIPHSDYKAACQGMVDIVCMLSLALGAVVAGADLRVIAGGAGGAIPDLEVAVAFLLPRLYRPHGRLRLVFPSHSGLIAHARLAAPWGVVTQALVIAGLAVLMLYAR